MSSRDRLVFQIDSYIREYNAIVTRSVGDTLYFDNTIFHPRSGGVDCDKGFIVINDEKYEIVDVYIEKETGLIAHRVSKPVDVSPGTVTKMIIDWDRRYRLMRLHTSAHILSSVMYSEYNALISGGNITVEYAYDDYTLERLEREVFINAINKANEIVQRDLEVKIYWLPREEALKIPGVVKLASRMPPEIKELRIVEIPGVDIQADGGPHVRRTSEIGEIVFLKTENKGKNKKRLYFTVKP